VRDGRIGGDYEALIPIVRAGQLKMKLEQGGCTDRLHLAGTSEERELRFAGRPALRDDGLVSAAAISTLQRRDSVCKGIRLWSAIWDGRG